MGKSFEQILKGITEKLFPRKRKKAIEEWDFIMVFKITAK